MKKTGKKRMHGIAGVLLCCIAAFTTCKNNIGLGSTIDINAPEIKSVYPPIGAVIKGDFILAVKAEDDTKIKQVAALVTSKNKDRKYAQNFILSESGGYWMRVINKRDENEASKPEKFMDDDTYSVAITVQDASGKETTVESAFTIDNTPPLLILSRPSTAVKGTADPAADVFGDRFYLAGQVYDKSDVAALTISATDDKGNEKGKAVLTNIPQSLRMTVDMFFKQNSSQKDGFYREIYGKELKGKQQYSYTIAVSDSARTYTDPKNLSGSGTGNTTNTYYLYDELYQLLRAYKPAELYAMQSGVYTPDPARSADNAASSWTPETALKFLQNPTNQLGSGSRKGTFALNPSINPKYGVEGFSPRKINTEPGSVIEADKLYNGSLINVKLSPNFDEDPLNPVSQYRFYLIDLEKYAAAQSKTVHELLNTAFDVNNDDDLYRDKAAAALRAGITDITPAPDKVNKSGSSYIASIKLEHLSYQSHYVLQVRGCDQNSATHTMIADPKDAGGGRYIFKIVKIGAKPEVYIKKINEKDPQAGRFYIKSGDNAVFDVVLKNTSAGSIEVKLIGSSGVITSVVKQYSAASGAVPPVPFTISKEHFVPGQSAAYRIAVQAKDSQGAGDSLIQEYQLYYDAEGPIITANVPNSVILMPNITGDIYDAGVGVDYGEGAFTAVYTYNGGAEQPLDFAKKPAAADNRWELNPIAGGEGSYSVRLTAKDTLGNLSSKDPLEFTYDTAAPKIKSINTQSIADLKKNPVITGGAVDGSKHYIDITGHIQESNGIKSVKVGNYDAAVSGSASGYTFTYRWQEDSDWHSEYPIPVEVTDKAGKTDRIDLSVIIDTEAPAFTKMTVGTSSYAKTSSADPFTDTAVENATNSFGTVSVSGSLKDLGSGVKVVTAEWLQDADNPDTKQTVDFPAVAVKGADGKYTDGIYKIEGALNFGTVTEAVVTFTAKDNAGKEAAWMVRVSITSNKVVLGMEKDISASTPALEKEGAHYVNKEFKIKVKGKWEGSAVPQALDFSVTKDGKDTFTLSDLNPVIAIIENTTPTGAPPRSTPIPQPLASGNTITHLISGYKDGAHSYQHEYAITFTPRPTGADDGRYVFTFKSPVTGLLLTETITVDTQGPAITLIQPQDGGRISKEAAAAIGKISVTMFDSAGINSGSARAYYRKKVGTSPAASAYKNLTAAEGYIALSGTPLAGTFADAKKWNGTLYATDPDTAAHTGSPAHTTSAAAATPAESDPSAKITEGGYEVWFGAQDNLNQLTTTEPITVVYDTADPTATMEVSTDGGTIYNSVGELYVKSHFKVKVGGSDTNGVTDIKLQLKKDDSSVTTWTDIAPTTVTSLSERAYDVAFTAPNDAQGAYTLRAVVTDKAGKQAVKTCSVVYDTQKPSLTVPGLHELRTHSGTPPIGTVVGTPPNEVYWINTSTLPIRGGSSKDDPAVGAHKASGIKQVAYLVVDNGTSWNVITTNKGSWTATVNPGTQGVIFRAQDKAGNSKEEPRAIKSDMIPPTLTVKNIKRQGDSGTGTADLSAVHYLKADAKLDITYTVADDANGSGIKANSVTLDIKSTSAVKHSLSGQPTATGDNTATISMSSLTESVLPDGDYTVDLSVMDNAGNTSVARTFNIKIDRKPPTITMLSPAPDSKHPAGDSVANWARNTRLFGKVRITGSFSDDGSGMHDFGTAYTYIIGKEISPPKPLLNGDTFKPISNSSWALDIANAENYCKTTDYVLDTDGRFDENDNTSTTGIIYKIPVYLAMKDKAGNEAKQTFYIMVDSSGKTPVIDIQAPDQKLSSDSDTDKAYEGREVITVGGSVQFSGLVQTANPAVGGIKKVYVSFSTKADFSDSFTAEFKAAGDSTAVSHNLAALTGGKGVEIAYGDNLKKWSFTVDTDKFVAGTTNGPPIGSDGSVTLFYKVQAENSEGTAVWTKPRKIKFDKNYPYVTARKVHQLVSTTPPLTYTEAAYVNNSPVKDGDMLVCELLSVNGISEITLKSSTDGADYINNIGTKTGDTAITGTQIDSKPIFEQIGAASNPRGYQMKLPIKLDALKDPDQILSIEVSITDNKTDGKKTNFVQFNLKYDKTDPAVIFGTPVGKIGTGNFSAASANDITAAAADMDIDDLYVFVETKDGSAKEIKVTGSGNGYITYGSVGEIFSNTGSMYVLVRKNTVVYDSAASEWQLQGFAYDTGTGVDHVKAKLGTLNAVTLNTFTPELGYFSSFKQPIQTSSLPDGKTPLNISVTDKAGRIGTAPSTDVYLRNKPLVISKVRFKTDLNGDNDYSNDDSTGREEEISAAGHKKYIDSGLTNSKDQRNYIQKDMDIHDEFSFKNKNKSQIEFELLDGVGAAYRYEVYKADTNGDKTGTVIKSSMLTGKIMNFTAADFASDKIPEGDNQKFVIILKETSIDDPARELRLTVTLNVKTKDISKPQVTVLPFYWNGEGMDESGKPRNSLPNGDRTKGHIEIAAVAGGGGVSDVSGTVVVRGTAYHPSRLTAIELNIPNVSPQPKVSYANGSWNVTTGSGLKVTDERLDVHGHWVVWEYEWKTGTPALAQTIKVTATRTEGSDTITSLNTDAGGELAQRTATRSNTYSMVLQDGDKAVKGQFIRLFDGEKSYLVTVNEINEVKVAGSNRVKISWQGSNVPKEITNYSIYKIDYGTEAHPAPTYNRASVTLNIVPYITGIETPLSIGGASEPDLYARTALGHYPVKDEAAITVKGFNLTGAQCKVKSKKADGSGDEYSDEVVITGTASPWTWKLPANAKSGQLVAIVGASEIEAINNKNDNAKDYNKAKKTANNGRLTDDVELDVWQFNSEAALPDRGYVAEPVMRINPKNNIIGFAFANGPEFFSMSNGQNSSYEKWHANTDDFGHIDFVYDSSGISHGVSSARDLNSGSQQGNNFCYVTSKWGHGIPRGNDGYSGTYALRLEKLGQISKIGGSGSKPILEKSRIQHPSLVAANGTGTDTRLYLAYYDSINDQIRFKAGTLESNMDWNYMKDGKYKKKSDGTDSNIPLGAWKVRKIVGTVKYWAAFPRKLFGQFVDEAWPREVVPYNQDNVSIIAGKYMDGATSKPTGNKTGTYLSLGVVPGATADKDVAVLIWFDATNKKLMYTYNVNPTKEDSSITPALNPPSGIIDNPDPAELADLKFDTRTVPPRHAGSGSGEGYWTTAKEVFGVENIGEYCKLAVDKNGGIHIAAYSTDTKDLHYAYLSSYNAASFTTSVVDSYGITGSQIRLDVALSANGNPIPYIGYYSPSAGYAKLAYLVDKSSGFAQGAAGAKDGYFTGDWEVTCIPTTSDIVEDNINVGVWKDAAGKVKASVAGSSSSTTTNGKVYGNGTANPVLGYAITKALDGFIETAQKK